MEAPSRSSDATLYAKDEYWPNGQVNAFFY